MKLKTVRRQMHFKTGGPKFTRYIPVEIDELSLIDVVDMLELSQVFSGLEICSSIWLGFCWLNTQFFANSGHFVRGIDINQDLIAQLKVESRIYTSLGLKICSSYL